jgi:hypothetical protein
VNNELGKVRREVVVAYPRCFLGIFLEGLRDTTGTSFRIADISAEIRTEHFPNKNLGS